MKLWLRALLVKSDDFCFLQIYHKSCVAVGVLHVMFKREFPLSVYNLNILLEGLCKNLEYGKTVILLRESGDIMPPNGVMAPTLESEGSRQCSNSGFNTIEHIGRLLLFNDFLSVERFKEFSASNTFSTEDEPYKGLSNLVKLSPAGELCSYLDDANSLDIQACIRECVWTAGD
ncbi:hypothetical protein HID58_054216 [Brassica napus]|uniref:Uncharacterized protein n=1 Tax=Brassica napus TaxID=3708 RepID=A0ABQ8AHM2_BRANA|nr:hypothetical protein HID58_054216 [Brassica napus]